MSSKSSISSNKRCDNLGLGTPRRKNQKRVAPTYRTKDREKMDNIRKTIPSRKQRRTERTKKDTKKWYDFHKIPWHNIVDFRSKK
jgi:hypothetical protein